MKVNPQVIGREVGRERVLLDPERGLYFGLNEVGSEVFGALERGSSIAAIEEALAGKYEVEREQLRADLAKLYSEFLLRGLVLEGDESISLR